jgi:hypothetical protein
MLDRSSSLSEVIAGFAKLNVYPTLLNLKVPFRISLSPIEIIYITIDSQAVAYPLRACLKKSLYFLYLVDIRKVATVGITA